MTSPALHVVKPGYSEPRIVAPVNVSIEATALLDVIESLYHDHSDANDTEYTRLIGTLLGTRTDDGHIIIKNAYIVPHKEAEDRFIFEESHHFQTFQLFKRSNMDLQVVGWFQTNETFDITTGLLHEFYTNNSSKQTQVLLTLNSKDSDGNIVSPSLNTYISSPIGLPSGTSITNNLGLDKSGAYAFIPIENKIVYSKRELNSLKFISKASNVDSDDQTIAISNMDELTQLSGNISKISAMVAQLLEYTSKVQTGELEGNEKIGNLLSSALKFEISSTNIEAFRQQIEKHSNDSLVVEYLSSCIKQQLELSSKLTNFMLPEDALRQ